MRYIIFLLAINVWAQVQPPRLGVMVDRRGAARPVFGVASSVTTGNALAESVISSVCSSQLCLFKTRSSIVWAGGETNAPPGPAQFALNGTSAYVYFSRSAQFAEWRNGSLATLDLNISGQVLSMLVTPTGDLRFAVFESGTVSVVDRNNQVQESIPGAGPVMLLETGVLYSTPDSLVLRRTDGSELHWPLLSIQGFSAMGDGYVQVRTASASFALRIDPGREQLFMLPETGR